MGEQQQMTPGEIATRLMDAGVDTAGSPRAIADEAIQDFIERVAELHRSQIGPLDVDDLREAARGFAGQDDFTRLAAVGPLEAWTSLLQSPPQGDITVTKGGLITVGRCAQCHASGPGPVDIQFDGQHLQLCGWHARRLSEALVVVLGIPPQQSVMVPEEPPALAATALTTAAPPRGAAEVQRTDR